MIARAATLYTTGLAATYKGLAAPARPIVLLLIATLSACTGLPTRQSESLRDFAPNTAIDAWQLRGKIGLKSSDRASSGYLNWRQCGDWFEIRINGPLGSGAAKLVGDSERVTLFENNNPPRSAATAEALLQERLGWQLPVAELIYWIRGIPSTHSRFRATELGFRQSGWELSFPRQTSIDGFHLPAKAIAHKYDLTVTLIFQQWQLGAECPSEGM